MKRKGGAPVGNKNAKRGLYIRSAFERYALEHPEDVQALIEAAYSIALGRVDAKPGQLGGMQFVAERSEGKAPQAVEISGELTTTDTTTLTDEELIALINSSRTGTARETDGAEHPDGLH